MTSDDEKLILVLKPGGLEVLHESSISCYSAVLCGGNCGKKTPARASDAWTWWIVGLFGCPASCCMSCVCAPWTWGLFMCFCAMFSLLNVEEVYNEHSLCCNCNSLTSHLPSFTVSLWGGPAQSSPLYHYGFEAGTASLRLRRCYLQRRRGHAVRAALAVGALRAPTAIRTFWLQCADSCAQ